MKKHVRAFLALSAVMGLSATAHAKVTHLGTLSDGDVEGTTGRATLHSGTFSFDDTVTFKVASASNVSDIFTALKGITTFTVSLFENGHLEESFSGKPTGTPSQPISHTFESLEPLAKGHYTLEITGVGTSAKARYFNAVGVSAVPEADTWLMLIAGVGLIAFQLRRRQNSLPQLPII